MGDPPTESIGEAIYALLRRLVRERLAAEAGGHLVEAHLDRLELPLSLALCGPEADSARFAVGLDEVIDRQVHDAIQHRAAFRPGHAYCHRCGAASCEHGLPPSPRHVFVGYQSTGSPRFEDFAQHCLDLKHPEVDRLYASPPALIALVQPGRELHRSMLRAFESPRYRLLGQVVAGFFPAGRGAGHGRSVMALTIQVAVSRGSDGRRRHGLNLLWRRGSDGAGSPGEREGGVPWRRAVLWAQAALDDLDRSARRARGSSFSDRRVARILEGLARRVVREHRARGRRTRHAQQRHVAGDRPTRKAVDDARVGGGTTLLVDERQRTVVVLGERGRTHFFTASGQHVSSVRYSREAIERKLKLELWRPATPAEAENFRGNLA